MRLLQVVLIVIFWCSAAQATTYYVDASGGNDGNAGTSTGAAWATLGHAVSVAIADDVVNFRTGTYTAGSNFQGVHAGSAGHPITFQRYQSEVATVIGTSTSLPVFFPAGASPYIILDGFIIDASTASDGIKINNGAHDWIVRNCEVKNSTNQGIIIPGDVGVGNNLIQNCNIHNNGSHSSFDHGIYVENNNNTVESNHIHDNSFGYGIHIYQNANSNNVIRKNYSHSNAFQGILVGTGTGHLVYNNITDGILVAFGGSGTIANNTIYTTGPTSTPLQVQDAGSNGAIIENNIVYGGANGLGAYLLTGATITIRNNLIVHQSNVAYNNDGTGTVNMSGNLFDASGTNTTGIYHTNFVSPGTDFHIQLLSSGKDTGLDLSALGFNTDYDGVLRPQFTAWDIGAYEFPVQSGVSLALNATSRQIVVNYTAPSVSACTIEVSESPTYSPVVNDVNPALFTGSNSDSRSGSLGAGTVTRTMLIGTVQNPNGTISNLAGNGLRYSRTLQTNTTHYVRVTCGTSIGTGSITTANIPLGKTYVEPLPVASAGVYALPTTNDTVRGETIIDPVYGTMLRSMSTAAEDLYVADGGAQIRCMTTTVNDSGGTPGYPCMFPTNGGAAQLYWINTANGESRYLGIGLYHSGGSMTDMPTTYLGASPDSKFDTTGHYYQISPDNSGDAHLIRCTLPASGSSTYNTSVSTNTDAPCTWADMTPNPNNLAALNLAFDPTFDKTKFSNYYRQSVDGGYFGFNVLRGVQDSYGWVGLVSLASNPITSVTALMPLWKRGSAAVNTSSRWCGIHSSTQIQGSGGNIFMVPKTMYQGGGAGLGPYTVSLASNMTSLQTTITFNTNTPTSPNPDTTLYDLQAGDEIGVPNDQGEHMLIVSQVSGTTWNVTRGIAGTVTAHTSGDGVIMACSAHRTGDVSQTVTDYWNAPANPTGNDTTDTFLVRFDDGFSGHGGRGLLRWISEAGYSACSNLSTITSPCPADFVINDSPTFNGASKTAAGNTYQKHPSPPDQLNAPSNEQTWGLDGFVNDADGLQSGPTSLTNVTGALWKFTNTNYTLSRKNLPMLAIVGGAHPMLDVSSSALGNTIDGTSTFNYKYCVAYKPGECRIGSLAGDEYINAPGLTGGSNCPTGNLATSDTSSVCFGHLPAWAQTINQLGIFTTDSIGKYVRSLSSGMAGIKTAGTSNAEMTPDGKWAWFPRDITGNRIAWMIKIPPFPSYDGVDRNTFIQKTVNVGAVGGATEAYVRFGYDPAFNCTSRIDPCVSATSNNPYFFENSDTFTATSCSTGCAPTVPVIPDRAAYAQIVWRNSSHVIVATSVTFMVVDGGGVVGAPTTRTIKGKVTIGGKAVSY